MKTLSALALFFFLASVPTRAQFLFGDNFDYPAGDSLRAHGWNITGTSVTNPVSVTSPGLTYTGYHSSGIGNAVTLMNNGQDVHDTLSAPVTSGSVYCSFMVNVSAAQAGDYFFHFTRTAAPTTDFFARTFVRLANNGNLTFGISKSSISVANPARYSDSVYVLNATYLLVVKYTFNTGSTTDDEVSLFVLEAPSLPLSEPATPTVGPVTTTQTDVTELGLVALRQGSSTLAPTLRIDGLQVGTHWGFAPLPVQLSAFTATRLSHSSAQLRWRTAGETNNFGFYVQRRRENEADFRDLPGSFVPGAGTTFLPQEYSYADHTIGPDVYHFRLRQVDLNGDEHFSDAVQLDGVTSVISSRPSLFALEQNYPNPFNPTTTFRFSVDRSGPAIISVYTLLGQNVATVFDGFAEAGKTHSVKFDASGLTSGVYFYKLASGTKSALKSFTLVK